MPKFVCAVPSGWVPEFDVFVDGKLAAKGWRSILMFLARQRLISLERARRVFACGSLGECSYDRATFDEKRALAEAP